MARNAKSMLSSIRQALLKVASSTRNSQAMFCKTGPGEYAEHDRFLGVTVPNIRLIAKSHQGAPLGVIKDLLESKYNEERFLALVLLNNNYDAADSDSKRHEIYDFYMDHTHHINNWNLVDGSAPYIVGKHLLHRDKAVLFTFARCDDLWRKRIAMVSTWWFIRNNELDTTFLLAEILLLDDHDLIQKAVGWMLREAGKKDLDRLISFLDKYASDMPRTMLRYAIEKLPKSQQTHYKNLVTA